MSATHRHVAATETTRGYQHAARGADDRVAGWREYVDAVVDAAHAQLAAEVARRHLRAIGWTLADGTHDSALGLGDSWGSGESTGLNQGEWSELCVRAVRRVARELYASTED